MILISAEVWDYVAQWINVIQGECPLSSKVIGRFIKKMKILVIG